MARTPLILTTKRWGISDVSGCKKIIMHLSSGQACHQLPQLKLHGHGLSECESLRLLGKLLVPLLSVCQDGRDYRGHMANKPGAADESDRLASARRYRHAPAYRQFHASHLPPHPCVDIWTYQSSVHIGICPFCASLNNQLSIVICQPIP